MLLFKVEPPPGGGPPGGVPPGALGPAEGGGNFFGVLFVSKYFFGTRKATLGTEREAVQKLSMKDLRAERVDAPQVVTKHGIKMKTFREVGRKLGCRNLGRAAAAGVWKETRRVATYCGLTGGRAGSEINSEMTPEHTHQGVATEGNVEF